MIDNLPKWHIADSNPAFYEYESATAIEMVAKLYAKVKELIESHNTFTEEMTKTFEDFKKAVNDNFTVFSTELRQEFQDFIDVIDLKIKEQDTKIDDAVDYMKNKIVSTTQNVVMSSLSNKEIDVAMDYDLETESLRFILDGGEL